VNRRDAVAEDLRALADNLKSLYESATTDPKERRRKERQFRALQGALGVLTTLVARKLVLKAWGILTGEEPPKRPPTARVKHPEPRTATEAVAPAEPMPQPPVETPPDPLTQVMSQSEAETMSSSPSSVK
jgi:hypothetical protein